MLWLESMFLWRFLRVLSNFLSVSLCLLALGQIVWELCVVIEFVCIRSSLLYGKICEDESVFEWGLQRWWQLWECDRRV